MLFFLFGNVDTLLQDVNQGSMKTTGNRFKKIIYDYDLISGKVNSVAYQKGSKDQFFHRYQYDAENRLTAAYTSPDGIYYERDATYQYYKHGPLARTIFGQQQVQAVTNAYTLQGWLKGIVAGTDENIGVAKPVFNYALTYYNGDYKAINATPFAAVTVDNFRPLYNGNIASMLVNVPKVGEEVLHNYRYDQLNRLTSVSNYNSYDKASNSWKATEEHKEALSYDANGNIQTALLNGNAAKLDYEQFSYGYDAVKKNRLLSINNSTDGKTYKYDYDSIGNVIKDELEGNKELQWNVYGKLSKVVKEDGTVIDFTYDAAGNRISKKVGNKEQWYVRDAQGNIMATYIKDPAVSGGKLSSESYYKYGSNMLGAWNKVRDVETALPVIEGTLERGQQELYLPNQLGNNMVIINDRKIQNDTNGDGIIDSYDAVVLKAADYSAFGDNLIGREFNGNKIKYGFNGKWNDVETGYQDYGFRMYSTKARRFNSVDPLTSKYPMLTPYQFASNNPVWMLDLDGLEGFKFSDVWNNRATLFDFIQNPDVTGTVGEFNRSFNPLFILNNYGVKLRTGHDYDGNPIDSRGKAGVIADLGVEAMQWMTIGKLFGSVPKATTAMEQEMTQASKAMGKIEATPKQAIAEEVTSTSSQQTVTQPIKSKFLGGAKGKLYSKWQILEANHAPTMQSFKLAGFDIPYNTGSAFQMLYKEHQLFVSSGPGKLAQAFRNQEANLLKEGKFLEAFDLTANKVNFKYGDKYKEAIGEAREYFQKEVVPRLEKQFKEKK